MGRGAHRRESQPPAAPAPAAVPAEPAPAAPLPEEAPGKLSWRWKTVAFVWGTAFAALALYELLQALFRLF
jgi:hypothetical protein